MRASLLDFNIQQARGTDDNFFQVLRHVIIQPFTHGKARKQRRRKQSAARRRADEREAREIQPDTTGVRALVNDDVQFEILHRGIEIFLDGFLEAMDFILILYSPAASEKLTR